MSQPTRAVIRPIAEVAAAEVERSRGASIQVLIGPDDGAHNFATRLFTLAPGGRIPTHRHARIEHEQVVLDGEIVIGLDQRVVTARAGDCLLIPAGTAHWYENRSGEPVRFLCVVPVTTSYQTEWLDDSDPL